MLPPRSILVAVDFSEPSRNALAVAARLAQQCGAALHVLHAEHPLLAAAAEESNIDLAAETREELRRFIDATPPAAACNPCLDVVIGPAVQVILHIGEREGAELVVLAARSSSASGRMLFGSTAEGVLAAAERSVLIVPEGWRPPHPDRPGLAGIGPLVVGIDFSSSSLTAAAAAGALAERLQTTVEAVHVVPALRVPARWEHHAERVTTQQVDVARRELARLAGSMTFPAPVTCHVESGRVADRLAEMVSPIGSRHPWLVLGRRGPKSRGDSPGSIAFRATTLASVPVLMHVEPNM